MSDGYTCCKNEVPASNHLNPMNKFLCLSAVLSLAVLSPALAGGEGRTVCVLRARPVAVQPAPRPVVVTTYGANVMSPTFRPSATISGVGPFPTAYQGPYWRVPVVYGNYVQRVHYVNPCLPNGYVGGLQNLPSNYVNIPRTFTRPAPRPAPPRGPAGGHPGGGAAPAGGGGK